MLFSVYYNGESKKGNMSPKHRRTLTPTPASFQRDTDCCTPGRQAKRQKCGTSNSVVKRNKAGACYFLPTLCQFSFVYSNKGMNSACIQKDTDCCTPGRQEKRQKCGTSNSVVKRNKAGTCYFCLHFVNSVWSIVTKE